MKKNDMIIRKILRINSRITNYLRWQLLNLLPNVTIGKKTLIEKNVKIDVLYGGYVKIGENCELRNGAQLLTYGGNIEIGDNSSINPYTIVYGQGNIKIGNYVRIAAHCVLIPSNHTFIDLSKPIYLQPLSKKGIIIKDDVWIGCGVRILDGVTIAKGCVIGAGSVVTKSTEPYGIYVGIPAKKIKSRI